MGLVFRPEVSSVHFTDAEGNSVDVIYVIQELEKRAKDSVDSSLCLEPHEWRLVLDCVKIATSI